MVQFACLAGLVALAYPRLDGVQPALQSGTVTAVTHVSHLFGLVAEAHRGWYISYGDSFGYYVVPTCVGLLIALLYTTSVLAFPTSVRNKLIGIGVGVPLLFAVNILRLVSLGWIGSRFPGTFDVTHTYGWGILSVAIVGAMWLLWIDRVVGREAATATPSRRLPGLVRAGLMFALLLVAGFVGAMAVYGRVVTEVALIIASSVTATQWVYGAEGVQPSWAYQYAYLAAAVALLAAGPQLAWKRVVGAGALVVALVALLQAIDMVPGLVRATAAIHTGVASGGFNAGENRIVSTLVRAGHIGVPLVTWVWLTRQRKPAIKRSKAPINDFERWKLASRRVD